MPRTEDDIIESLFGATTVVEKAKARGMMRMARLMAALQKTAEPEHAFVLATSDGRTLDLLEDHTICLDVGDQPRHWSAAEAQRLAVAWNRDKPSTDHVQVVQWRKHYEAQLPRIAARLEDAPPAI